MDIGWIDRMRRRRVIGDVIDEILSSRITRFVDRTSGFDGFRLTVEYVVQIHGYNGVYMADTPMAAFQTVGAPITAPGGTRLPLLLASGISRPDERRITWSPLDNPVKSCRRLRYRRVPYHP